jgi:DNA-binding transcriptional regulator LsrR (DeoR family)
MLTLFPVEARRKVVALVAIVGIALSGPSQLLAATPEKARDERTAASQWFVQLLDNHGRAINPPAKRTVGALTADEIEQARGVLAVASGAAIVVAVAGSLVLAGAAIYEFASCKGALPRHLNADTGSQLRYEHLY